MTKALSFAKGVLRLRIAQSCKTILPKAFCLLIISCYALSATSQDKVLTQDSRLLQQAYNKLGVTLEKNKDSIISGRRKFRQQLKSLNKATEKYLRLPDSLLRAYATLPAYKSIDSLLRNKVRSIPKQYAQSFLHINKLDNHISQVKSLQGELSNLYKTDIRNLFSSNSLFKHSGFNAAYSGQTGQSFIDNGAYYMSNASIYDAISINNIPLLLSYTYQQFSDAGANSSHVFNAQFDKDAFLDSYRKKLQGKLKPEDIFPKDAIVESAVKAAEMTLQHELDAVKEKYKNIPAEALRKAPSLSNLVTSDISTVRTQALGSISLASIADKERIINELQTQVQSGAEADTARLAKLRNEVSAEKASVEMFNVIEQHKKKWESSGLVKKVMEDENLRNLRFRELLNDPSSIRDLAGKYLRSSGIEKLLMMVNSVKGGRQAVTLDRLSMNNFLADGMSMEMQSGSKYLFVLFGKQRQFNSMYDAAAFNPLQQQGNLAMGIRLGTGELNGTQSHISIFSYNNKPSNGNITAMPGIERSNLVISLSNKLISGPSAISFEVSHSSARFKNEFKGELLNEPSATQHRFADGLAMDVQYEANFEDIGLDLNVNGLMTGRDYFNPGNTFLTQGMKQLDFAGQKSFLKNQLQLRLRNNWRQIEFAQVSGSKWRQNMLMVDARWQLNNGQYVGLQYQPMRSIKLENGAKYRMSVTDRLSASFNLHKRVGPWSYSNLLNLSHNKTDQSGGIYSNYKIMSSAVQLNSIQSIAFRKHTVYWNTLYSYVYDKSNTFYSNDLFNADAGFTYNIAGKLHASSGLNYYSVKGWHAVAGIRQTFNASFGQKLMLDIFIDWRTKVKETQYFYHEPLRADCSVRYIF